MSNKKYLSWLLVGMAVAVAFIAGENVGFRSRRGDVERERGRWSDALAAETKTRQEVEADLCSLWNESKQDHDSLADCETQRGVLEREACLRNGHRFPFCHAILGMKP